MANVIDIIVSKQAQAELDKVIASLKLTHEEIIKINQQGLKINSGASPKNPIQMNNSVKETIALNEKLDATNKKLVVNAKQMEQQSIKESNARNSLNKQREQSLNLLAKEQQKIAQLGNYYNKTQQQLNTIQQAYNNLAVKKERYNNLSSFEENRLKTLQMLTEKYNGTLKTVDATIGKHTRNVGNYASGFNPLNNSIAQLTREAPAFANSVQTGFMAISNNLPIFFDAMQGVIAQNKELQAQGKPTKSVLGQLASSLFSFQTLLSVGVTLLTLYGKEIVNWASNISIAEKTLNDVKKAQLEIQSQSAGQAKDLDKYRDVVVNTNLSEKERLRALKLLKEQIPELAKVELNHADALQQVNKYTDYYIKQSAIRYKSDQFIKKAGEELIKQEEIRQRLLKGELGTGLTDYLKAGFSIGGVLNANTIGAKANANAIKRLDEEFGASILAQKEYEKSAEIQIRQLDVITTKTTEKTKVLKAEKDLVFDLVDVYASMFELNKLYLEREIKLYDELANSEHELLEDRIRNFNKYTDRKIQLQVLEYNESVRLSNLEYTNEVKNLQTTYLEYVKQDNVTKSQRIGAKNELNKALKALDEKNKIDLQVLELKHSDSLVEINAETFEKIAKLRELYNGLEFNKKIKDQEFKDLLEHKNRLYNIDIKTTKKQLDDIAKSKKDSERKIQEETLKNDIANINKKLANEKLGAEEELRLKSELYQKLKELNQLEIADLEEKKKKQEDYLKLLDDTFNGFIQDFGNKSGFGKTVDLLNGGLEKFKGNAKATALAISEAFQEAFNTISEASQRNFDAEYSRLEMQKNVSILFAGESTVAKEEIERQYEQKRKAIQRREAEAQKRLAVFNIAINTAQAIIAAAPKIPLMIAMGVIGAAQLALVQSQEIPAFWKGTDNAPEGLAWTQEKGAEVITDKKGNIKTLGNNKGAQLTYLEKGDKVYKSQQDYINKTLVGAGIQPMRENNSLTSSDFNNGISKLSKTMQSNKGSNTQVFLNNKQINTDSLRGIGKKV